MQRRLWYQIDKSTLFLNPTIYTFVEARTLESKKLTPLVQNSNQPTDKKLTPLIQNSNQPRDKARIRLPLKIE